MVSPPTRAAVRSPALAALWAVWLVLAAPAGAATLVNPGFETGDFSGWVLNEDSGIGFFGTWGVLVTGTAVGSGASVFDHHDGINVTQRTPGLPTTFHATEGSFLAVQLQRGPETHRMYQDVTLLATDTDLIWDMRYENHATGGFDPARQYLAVHVRDPVSDAILATVFRTDRGDPLSVAMSSFTADVSAFAGRTVRLDVELEVQDFYFDVAFDNFAVTGAPEPGSVVLLGLGLALLGSRRGLQAAKARPTP